MGRWVVECIEMYVCDYIFVAIICFVHFLSPSPGPTQILSRSHGEKSGEGLVSKLHHDRKWWTRFRNDGNVPTHNVAGVGQFNPP